MGWTVGHWFHLNHEEFFGRRLRKKRSDPDFSVQKIGDGDIHGCEPTELPGIFPDEEVWRLLSVVTENNILKEESQLLPNHHIVCSTRYSIEELESQLLPNGSLGDGVRYDWEELESQLLPNRHIVNVATCITSELESQLLPNSDMKYTSYIMFYLPKPESQLLPNEKMMSQRKTLFRGGIFAATKSLIRGEMVPLIKSNIGIMSRITENLATTRSSKSWLMPIEV